MMTVQKVVQPKRFELVSDNCYKPTYTFVVREDEVDVSVIKWHCTKRQWRRDEYPGVPVAEARKLWQHLTKNGYKEF